MHRRDAISALVATSASPLLGCEAEPPVSASPSESQGALRTASASGRMPALFLAHGSPFLVDDARWMAELRQWAGALPRPRSILMLSAHWVDEPITLSATRRVPLVYDFYGFPERYYQLSYAAPAAPDLARRARALIGSAKPVRKADRGLDHGAYIPLLGMYPQADIPVLQMSLPSLDARRLFDLGRALAPLRDEGVLIVGSGFLTHNLRLFDRSPNPTIPSWAQEFDEWARRALEQRDVDALLDYQRRAPAVTTALPTVEHFVPVIAALGAASSGDPVRFPITGFAHGSFTRRSVQWG